MLKSLSPLVLVFAAACAATPGVPSAALHLQEEAQGEVYTTPNPMTKAACREHRDQVAKRLGTGALAISSGPDVEGRFQADAHFYWLTGVNIPGVVLLLKATDGELVSETLFLPKKDPNFERWNGLRLAPGSGAEEVTGIQEAADLDTWPATLAELETQDLALMVHGDALTEETDAPSATSLLRKAAAVHSKPELEALQSAISITQDALVDAFRIIQPGVYEFQAEAAIESGFRKRGASGPSFPSIIGSGPNTCFLHYRDNRRRMQAGELVVMDVGARYQGFAADVTRTIPVSGQFTERQRFVYQAVWDASIAGAAELRPGSTIRAAHKVAAAVLDERGLGKYFLHSVGHGLGLLVHDAPGSSQPLEPGMVVTIEPGAYLAEEDLGVRIENDWLITEDGARCLSTAVPSEPDKLLEFLAKLRPTETSAHL